MEIGKRLSAVILGLCSVFALLFCGYYHINGMIQTMLVSGATGCFGYVLGKKSE